jgi:rhamnose transport system substrate-binding protein
MKKKALVFLLVLLTSLACVFNVSAGGQQDSGGAAEVKSASDLNVVFIPKNTGNPYFDSIIGGFEKAAGEIGFTFTTVAPATAEATSQIPFLKTQIQRGVDVIAISPNSPDALNQVFKQAMDEGIKVIIVNSDIPGSEDYRDVAVLPMDFEVTGSSQIELMGSLIDYEGDIAILSATTDAPDQNYWIEGMKEALKKSKYSKMNLVDVVYGDDDPQKSTTEAEALLTKYPNLRGIICPTTVGAAAVAQVVENAGRAPELQVTGLGTPNQMRRFVKNGTVEAFALWSPFDEGYLAAYLGVDLATGEVEAKEGATFNVPGLGERVIGENRVVITGPPTVFTAENIDDFDF